MKIRTIEDFKQPAYTGENRCKICTVLNVVIAVLAGTAIARKNRLGGVISVFVSLVLIYLRGYLIPRTPTLTKRHLPDSVLQWFGKDSGPKTAHGVVGTDTDSEPTADSTDVESYLLNHNILEPTDDDLELTDSFETAWMQEMESLADSGLNAATVIHSLDIDADPANYNLVREENDCRVAGPNDLVARWPSYAAAIADIAAGRIFAKRSMSWEARSRTEKGEILNGLRLFLTTCPTTGGKTSINSEIVESCCSSHEVVAVTCDDTGERVFEHPIEEVA